MYRWSGGLQCTHQLLDAAEEVFGVRAAQPLVAVETGAQRARVYTCIFSGLYVVYHVTYIYCAPLSCTERAHYGFQAQRVGFERAKRLRAGYCGEVVFYAEVGELLHYSVGRPVREERDRYPLFPENLEKTPDIVMQLRPDEIDRYVS